MYQLLFKHVAMRLSAERAHHLTMGGLKALAASSTVLKGLRRVLSPAPRLERDVLGVRVQSPLMLAAGFDKNAEATPAFWALGFGGVEVGTVTSEAQPGNEQPRLWRFPAERAIVNRMGFNNDGVCAAVERLATQYRPAGFLVGGSIGKLKTIPPEAAAATYADTAVKLAPYVHYLAVNVSSPNTPGLRALQQLDELRSICEAVLCALEEPQLTTPVLVKIAPDLSDDDITEVAEYVRDTPLAGLICTNTTIDFTLAPSAAAAAEQGQAAGGLSGAPLANRSREVLKLVRAVVPPEKVVISVGGIVSAHDVRERLLLGADLVQVYSVLPYAGPLWAWRTNRALAASNH